MKYMPQTVRLCDRGSFQRGGMICNRTECRVRTARWPLCCVKTKRRAMERWLCFILGWSDQVQTGVLMVC